MDCSKATVNPYAQEEYALYLALQQLIAPSVIISDPIPTLATFSEFHPVATHRLFQRMAGILMIQNGLEPVPLVEQPL
jgi:hypothetical protein